MANEQSFTLTFKTIADATGLTVLIGGLKGVENQAKETAAAVNSANNASGGGANAERDAAIQARALVLQRERGLTAEQSVVWATNELRAQEKILGTLAEQAAVRAKNLAAQEAQTAAASGAAAGAGSLLMGPVGIAAAAAYGLYNFISTAADESLRMAQEMAHQSAELEKQVGLWVRMAEGARTYSDIVRVGEKAESGIEAQIAKLNSMKEATRGWFETLSHGVASLLSSVTGEQFGTARDEATAQQEERVKQALLGAKTARQIAEDAKATFDAAQLKPLGWAIDEYTQKIAALKAQQAAIDPNRSFADLQHYNELDHKIELAGADLEKLLDKQRRLARETENLAAAIEKADFEKLDSDDKVQSLNEKLAETRHNLHELGIEAETPKEAMAQMEGRTDAAAEAARKLVGIWLSVGNAVAQAVAQAAQMASARSALEDKLNVLNAQAFGTRDEAYKAEWGQRYNQILKEREKIGADISGEEINAQIYAEKRSAERLKEWRQEDSEAKKASSSTKAANQELVAGKYELTSVETTYRNQLEQTKLLEEAGYITSDQAQQRNIRSTQAYLAELKRVQDELPSLIAKLEAMGNTKGAEQLKHQLEEIANASLRAQITLQNSSGIGSMITQVRQLAAEWGNTAKQMGSFLTGSLNTAINSTSQAITGLIFGTKNWKQAFAQAAQSIVNDLIRVVLQMTIGKAIGSILTKANAQEQTQAGAQIAAAHAPAAAATSISSWGGAAVAGAAAAAIAIAAIIGALAGGFEQGGFTGGHEGQVAGFVHGEEVVFPAPRVRELGRDWLVDMAVGSLSKPGYAQGGFVGNAGGTGGRAGAGGFYGNVILVADIKAAAREAMKEDYGKAIILDAVTGARIQLGMS